MFYIELLAVFLLTLMNGLLAMVELAVISSRKSRLEQLVSQGHRGARSVLLLIENQSRFLSTVQIGITLIGIISGAFSGATLGRRLAAWLNAFPLISPHGDVLGVGITVIVITYLSLILGELVPKRIALAQPERIASILAIPMKGLSLITAPAVWVLHVSSEGVLRALGLSTTRESAVTEDEVKSLIVEGTRTGVFVPFEKEMIEGVLRLADRSVRIIMTPRSQIIWIDVQSDKNAILELTRTHRFSRLLVCKGSVDHPIGVVHTKDLLPDALLCGEINLADLLTPLLYVPEGISIIALLNRFKKEKMHIAAVVDEYGSIEGLVTLTDVIETIAGDLPERGDKFEPRIIQRNDGSWLVDGTLPTDEVKSITGIHLNDEVMMLAEFVLIHLGRIPEVGASFNYRNASFEVVDMDGNRIDKVLIKVDRENYEPHNPSRK